MDHYEILGIHGEDVTTVNVYEDQDNDNSKLIEERNVARVRMFIGKKIVDEDFDLPVIPPSVMPTTEFYNFFLKEKIEARMKELQ